MDLILYVSSILKQRERFYQNVIKLGILKNFANYEKNKWEMTTEIKYAFFSN